VDASNNPQTVLVDSVSAAVAVDRPKSTIRGWAKAGLITKRAEDAKGRSMYDLAEVYQVATRMATKKAKK
jgi:DNA-binding transcriptional MerR regulator